MELEPLEIAVLKAILAGDHPVLTSLRRQLTGLTVTRREFSGVGFFTHFSMAPEVPAARLPPRASPLGDVTASITGLEHGAGFLLFVKNGRLEMLEGYSWANEPWPRRLGDFALGYRKPDRRALLEQLTSGRPDPVRN